MNNFVMNNIPSGANIITDYWRGYLGLHSLGYTHHRINHKIHFVDPEFPFIHTNNIERTWRSLREWLPYNITEENVNLKLKDFEFEFNNKISSTSERFENLIIKLREYLK